MPDLLEDQAGENSDRRRKPSGTHSGGGCTNPFCKEHALNTMLGIHKGRTSVGLSCLHLISLSRCNYQEGNQGIKRVQESDVSRVQGSSDMLSHLAVRNPGINNVAAC